GRQAAAAAHRRRRRRAAAVARHAGATRRGRGLARLAAMGGQRTRWPAGVRRPARAGWLSMLVRVLFVLLGLANIALGAWLWLGQPYAPTGALPPADPGVPLLQLLSELPPDAGSVAAPAASTGLAAAAGAAPT